MRDNFPAGRSCAQILTSYMIPVSPLANPLSFCLNQMFNDADTKALTNEEGKDFRFRKLFSFLDNFKEV
ncbi:hypothetical protein CEXT_176591 [Caerostris extrusa]|uniref:Uncharacterized protein n=1 Tax=Caerostris extrusa TaxID=172846 RepID=A0AAV4ND17_CAEEX|nr:hypothetical protein CEXT_176591 [Caerostris extrusa]